MSDPRHVDATEASTKDLDEYERLYRNLSLQKVPDEKGELLDSLRGAAKLFGRDILDNCPNSRERSVALTHLEDALQWAVKSIVVNP